MNKRINIAALFMVFAILICEINLCLTDNAYNIGDGAISGSLRPQNQSITADTDSVYIEFCTPELIGGYLYESLFNLRLNAKGKESQNSNFRILTLFTVILCLLEMAYRHLNFGGFLSKETDTSGIILCYIHNKDGKK